MERASQPLQNIMEEKLRIVCDDSAAATGGSRASNAGRLRRSPLFCRRVQLVSSCVTARAQVELMSPVEKEEVHDGRH